MLTPSDIHNIRFSKPPLGKRGYDEQEVDAFLEAVEHTLIRLHDEMAVLRGHTDPYPPSPAAETAVLAELGQIRERLSRIEAAVRR